MGVHQTRVKVGELARRSGLTIRTLRYYDQIGLLSPTHRTSGGQRLYDGDDVRRLYRICLLRRIGFALEGVGQALDDPDGTLTTRSTATSSSAITVWRPVDSCGDDSPK